MFRSTVIKIFIALLINLSALLIAFGQISAPAGEDKKGSIKFTAQVEINGKTERLDRKRFYLIRGSRQQNAELLKKAAETNITSRDCYYDSLRRSGRQISDQFVCWLKDNDCESPYCREVKTTEEALAVPEFASAYRQGLREYKQPLLALKWLPTNLPDYIRIGYYEQQKPVLENLIALAKSYAQQATQAKKGSARAGDGFQSIMTDRLGSAYFLDIDVVPPEGKKTETYLVSNLLPAVFGDTSYVWTCEIEVDPTKPQAQFVLKTEIGKKKCEVVAKKQSEACTVPKCGKVAETPPATN